VADTALPDGQADTGNWEARYLGLQKVLSKREQELADARRVTDERQASFESDLAELRQVRAERAAANEERLAQERAEFEEFQRTKDEPATPHPIGGTNDNMREVDRARARAQGDVVKSPDQSWP
jgi:multidrug efflux pump subunit AcrA (membrane-fusion protein)